MLLLAQISISNDFTWLSFFFFFFFFFFNTILFSFLVIANHVSLFFVPIQQPSLFPLSCSCSAQHKKKCAQLLWIEAGMLKKTLLFSFLFLQNKAFYFDSFLLLAFLSCTSTKKPNNHFFDKVSSVLFFSFTYFFLLFLGLATTLLFDLFFLQGLRIANSSLARTQWLIFAGWHGAGKARKALFPLIMWHHTADPIGGFLWVSFVAVVGFLLAG